MLTQIYEVTTPSEADAISGLGIDHVGLLVGNGVFPRERSTPEAIAIMAAIRATSRSSALFLSADVALVEQTARELRPSIIHLGASTELLRPENVVDLRKALPNILFMRSVPVTGPESIATAKSYDGIVDFILLDSHREGDVQIGALGVTHDWNLSRHIVENVRTPVILAGGLGPDNVVEAILAVKPAGVDSKTRTDFGDTHTKDLIKVEAFNKAAKGAALM